MAKLRQGAKKGRKVLWVWDKALVDLPLWQDRKGQGIYFLSQRKKGMCLELEQTRVIDVAQPINQGVTGDRLVRDRRGIKVREITCCNPCAGVDYVYRTSEMTLERGHLVLLYKTRWESEKVFDETKTKLQEKKSWATSPTAQPMQAHFVAIVHNLLLLQQDGHRQPGLEYAAEKARKQKRQEKQMAELATNGQTLPLVYQTLQRCTQATVKLTRWLRSHWHDATSLQQAQLYLRALHAKL